MNHSPTQFEQDLIDDLVATHEFEFVCIRLTRTMLEKGIVDAGSALRAYLKQAGVVEYAAITQGAEFGVRAPIPVITADGTQLRQASYYRPASKQGDPRFWIAGLGQLAKPGDLLLVAFGGQSHAAIVLSANVVAIGKELNRILPLRRDRSEVLAEVIHLAERIKAIKERGWVRTLRSGDTGVGFTFESLLGIAANISQLADHEGIELKAHRLRARATDPLITLFAKTPRWGVIGSGANLVKRHGYYDAVRSRQALYCTITRRKNALGWSLVVDTDLSTVRVLKGEESVVDYSFATLQKRLSEKHPSTLFVAAQTRGIGSEEEFLYCTAVYCRQPSFADFLTLVEEEAIGLDFTAHLKADGRVRDHGYLWRIRESEIPNLYAFRKQLI